MKIIAAFVLLLYVQSEIIEHTGPFTMSECLQMKRQIERNGWQDKEFTRYSCEERNVEIDIENHSTIIRLVD